MIGLPDIPPPPDAEELRWTELKRLWESTAAQGRVPKSEDFGSAYSGRGESKPWRKALWDAQDHKCAFCEAIEQVRHRTVEHIRPKTQARRLDRAVVCGYWWLAWSWDNLVFCCQGCNTDKNIDFPLARGGRPLAPFEEPPGRERPLLINPRCESAILFIQFRKVPIQGVTRWRPFPRGNHPRGHWTIQTYKLDRDELLDLYTVRAEELNDEFADLQEELEGQDIAQIQRTWSRLVRRRLRHPSQPFLGLTYDLLDQTFPRPLRDRWSLDLPIPGAQR